MVVGELFQGELVKENSVQTKGIGIVLMKGKFNGPFQIARQDMKEIILDNVKLIQMNGI